MGLKVTVITADKDPPGHRCEQTKAADSIWRISKLQRLRIFHADFRPNHIDARYTYPQEIYMDWGEAMPTVIMVIMLRPVRSRHATRLEVFGEIKIRIYYLDADV